MKKHEFVVCGKTKEVYCIHCGLVIDDWLIKDVVERRDFMRLIYCDADENNKI